jgi:phage portal protein BeeE
MSFDGGRYLLGQITQTLQGDREAVPAGFDGYAGTGYKGNGVTFAVSLARMRLFSGARFRFQQLRNGQPGDLFGTQALDLLDRPDWNTFTGDLLARMDQDVTLAGNWFGVAKPGGPTGQRIVRLRPDWVTIVLGSQRDAKDPYWQSDAEIIGYAYTAGGPNSGNRPEVYLREEVAHYSPYPDPEARYRGMSWMTPILRELDADTAATKHKAKFFENGATPNLVVKPDAALTKAQFDEFVTLFKEKYEGVDNAYKTMLLGGGADVTVVGSDMRQLDFKMTQGAGETRICAAGSVPPIIPGFSEGLQAATYSNYGQARRHFGDLFGHPHWQMASGVLEVFAPPPASSRLWYDSSQIAFLREDQADLSDIRQKDASTIRTLVDAGYEPKSVIDAVTSGDMRRLVHTGLLSVQLFEPGSNPSPDPAPEPDAKE